MNRSKAKGTAAETAVLRQIVRYFPDARRNVQHGSADEGDIFVSRDIVVEVKGGNQTKQIGDVQLASWWLQTMNEARNAGAEYGILVTQRSGYGAPNAHRWWAWIDLHQLAELMGGDYRPLAAAPLNLTRLELGTFLEMLADLGFTPDHAHA